MHQTEELGGHAVLATKWESQPPYCGQNPIHVPSLEIPIWALASEIGHEKFQLPEWVLLATESNFQNASLQNNMAEFTSISQ